MSKRVLIAGVNGFVGHHLARELSGAGHTVVGVGLDTALSPQLSDAVGEFHANCDLTDADQVSQLPLSDIDAVINLAGLANVGDSFKPGAAERYTHINVAVHTTLAERLRELGKRDTRVIAVSTGAVYDNTQPMPISEDGTLLQDGSPYALSKITMEQALAELRVAGQDIVVVRPFNHIGPGQLPGFIVPDLISQLQSGGPTEPLMVGDLTTKRDYTDVRDVARAYRLLVEAPVLNHPVYNVCSGTSHSGQEILDTLLDALSLQQKPIVRDETKIRPNDPRDIRGNNQRIAADTGWSPTISFEQTLRDCLSD